MSLCPLSSFDVTVSVEGKFVCSRPVVERNRQHLPRMLLDINEFITLICLLQIFDFLWIRRDGAWHPLNVCVDLYIFLPLHIYLYHLLKWTLLSKSIYRYLFTNINVVITFQIDMVEGNRPVSVNPWLSSSRESTCCFLEKPWLPDLSFLSGTIVRCDFSSLALTGWYNELEAPQKRLLRYIRQGSHVLLWHKNTIYWDRDVHLGTIFADMMGFIFFWL